MDRDIKFRAHLKETGLIHRVVSMAFDERWVTISTESGLRTIGINWVDIVQYIERKDINGKEIYDGDIVKLHCGSNKSQAVTATITKLKEYPQFIAAVHDKQIWHAIRNRMVSMREMHSWTGMHNCFSFSRYTEVIGNIYENPELLRGYHYET